MILNKEKKTDLELCGKWNVLGVFVYIRAVGSHEKKQTQNSLLVFCSEFWGGKCIDLWDVDSLRILNMDEFLFNLNVLIVMSMCFVMNLKKKRCRWKCRLSHAVTLAYCFSFLTTQFLNDKPRFDDSLVFNWWLMMTSKMCKRFGVICLRFEWVCDALN